MGLIAWFRLVARLQQIPTKPTKGFPVGDIPHGMTAGLMNDDFRRPHHHFRSAPDDWPGFHNDSPEPFDFLVPVMMRVAAVVRNKASAGR
jgi:hypothetical protein